MYSPEYTELTAEDAKALLPTKMKFRNCEVPLSGHIIGHIIGHIVALALWKVRPSCTSYRTHNKT